MLSFKAFKIKRKHFVLRSDELVFPSTGTIVLRGAVGSGKSTILKFMFRGKIKAKDKRNRPFSSLSTYIPASFNIMPDYTGNAYLKRYEKNSSFSNEDFISLAKELNIYQLLNYKVSTYSDGEKSRFFFALGLSLNKHVILLDEPTARVDINTSKIIYNIIKKYEKSHLFIIASHDDIFDDINDKVLSIENNRVHCNYTIVEENVNIVKNRTKVPIKVKTKISLVISSFLILLVNIITGLFCHPYIEGFLPSKANYFHSCYKGQELNFLSSISEKVYNENIIAKNIIIDTSLHFKIKNINISSKNNLALQKIDPSLETIPCIPLMNEDEDKIKITSGLFNLLKKLYGNFNIKDLIINNNLCDEVIKDSNYYILVPNYLHSNFYVTNAQNVQVQKNIKIFDDKGKQIELSDNSIAVHHSIYLQEKGKEIEIAGKKLTVDSYFYNHNDLLGIDNGSSPLYIVPKSLGYSDYYFKNIFFSNISYNSVRYIILNDLDEFNDKFSIKSQELKNYQNYTQEKNYKLKFIVYLVVELCLLLVIFALNYVYIRQNQKYFYQYILDDPNIMRLSFLCLNKYSLLLSSFGLAIGLLSSVLFINSLLSFNIIYLTIAFIALFILHLVLSFLGLHNRLKHLRKNIL